MKTVLVFPPFWSASQPYLSLPCIASYLKVRGFNVEQIDLNLQIYDYVLSKPFLEQRMHKILEKNAEHQLFENNNELLETLSFLSRNIEKYKKMYRSEEALDIKKYTKCFSLIEYCLAIISKLYEKENLSFVYYEHKEYSELKSKDVIRCMEDVKNGKLKDSLVMDLISPFIDRIVENNDLVGISLTGTNQIIPTFILATLLKEKNPNLKIVLGGNIVSRWCDLIQSKTELFMNVDYFMYGEGEYPFTKLIEYLEGKITIQEVPNILYLNDANKVEKNEDNCYLDINSLPTPIFNKEDIPKYFAPSVVLPLLASRGCFWGKCSFCDHSYIYHGTYRKRSIDLIIQDIKTLSNEYGCSSINFHDEAIAPVEMEELSQRLLDDKMNIKWTTCARLDLAMSKELLKKAHDAGLKVLFFGLESINQRVLQKMRKGTKVENIKKILKDSSEVNIWNHVFFICGFPTETKEEFMETLDFVQNNSKYIHSSGSSYFTLGKFSDVYYHPEKYEIQVLEDDNDFALFSKYKTFIDDRYTLDYYFENVNRFSTGEFLLATNHIYRDHWVLFSDYLFQHRYDTEEKDCITLEPSTFWEVFEDKLIIYKINYRKMKIVKLGSKYQVFMDAIIKFKQREKIIDEISHIANVTNEQSTKYWNAFYKVLSDYELLDNNSKTLHLQ